MLLRAVYGEGGEEKGVCAGLVEVKSTGSQCCGNQLRAIDAQLWRQTRGSRDFVAATRTVQRLVAFHYAI